MSQSSVVNGKNRELIEELGCCPKGHYCTLKEILIRSPRDTRMLMLIKCLEKFKYERSEREQREIGWDEALDRWIAEGRADTFARLFRDGVSVGELYAAVLNEPSKP
jgi:hypothetical protein